MIEFSNIQRGLESLKHFLIFMLNHDGRGLPSTVVAIVIVLALMVATFPRDEGFRWSRLWILSGFPALWILQAMLGGILAHHLDASVRDPLMTISWGLLAAFVLLWLYCHFKLESARWFVFVVVCVNLVFMLMATLYLALMQI